MRAQQADKFAPCVVERQCREGRSTHCGLLRLPRAGSPRWFYASDAALAQRFPRARRRRFSSYQRAPVESCARKNGEVKHPAATKIQRLVAGGDNQLRAGALAAARQARIPASLIGHLTEAHPTAAGRGWAKRAWCLPQVCRPGSRPRSSRESSRVVLLEHIVLASNATYDRVRFTNAETGYQRVVGE